MGHVTQHHGAGCTPRQGCGGNTSDLEQRNDEDPQHFGLAHSADVRITAIFVGKSSPAGLIGKHTVIRYKKYIISIMNN